MKIHVSEVTKESVDQYPYKMEERGTIEVKVCIHYNSCVCPIV